MATHLSRLAACALPMLTGSLFAGLVSSPSFAQDTLPVPVFTPTVKEIVEYDEYAGRFEAVKRVEVRARVSGYLDSVEFQEGQIVEPGDLLYVIDQRPFRISLEAARAALAEAEANRDLADIEARRSRDLIKRNAIAQDVADANEQALLASVARVSLAQAQVAEAQLNLDYTEVRAPFRGRVGEQLVDEGNLVSGGMTGATLLTTIVQQDPLYFVFEVSEQDFLRYARLDESGGRPTSRTTPNAVAVRLIDEDDYQHHGVMDFVDNELDPTSGTLEGRAVFANPNGFIQPGTFGRARLQGSGLYNAVLIPDSAVQFDQSRQFVYTLNEDNTVGRVWIKPGPIVDGMRVVREGLSGEEQLIGGNYHRLRIGMSVSPKDTD
jgi:RND family efflux transporter MFP subunit